MKKKKLLACLTAGTMVLSMAACGNGNTENSADSGSGSDQQEQSQATPAPTSEADVTTPEVTEASIDFEDGNMDFVKIYTKPANADNSEISIVDYNGSKALQIKNVSGQVPYVGIDASSLLGADVSKVATMEASVGISYDNGGFSAVSGKIYAWSGADLVESSDTWSIYVASKNPNTAVATLGAGEEFVAGANNIFILSLETDNGINEGNGNATFYIDNIRFLDASGNLLTADSSVAFAAPAGFEKTGHDTNLMYVSDEVDLGLAASNSAWAQTGVAITDEMRELFVPGSVITINYKADSPVWLVATATDDNSNPLGNWLRGVNQETFVVDGYVASDNSAVQYTYEQLVPYFGEDFGQYLDQLQCESSADWEVYSVTVGTRSDYVTVGSKTALEGFAASNSAWAQTGITITDEMRGLFVPGSIIEIEYKADSPVWLVATATDDNPNPLGNWLRGVNQETFVVDGAVSPDNSKVQYTYEQLVPYFGEDFGQYLDQLQCESSADWEVYSVSVGKPLYATYNNTSLEGFAASNSAWAQTGIDITDDMKALIVPGSVINIYYKADSPVWLVATASDDNPNPLGNWLRGVNQETFVVDGAVTDDNSMVQYTYEQLVPYFGEDFAQYLLQLQCESSADWEVYSVVVGQY